MVELGVVVTGPDGARRDLRVLADGDAAARQLFERGSVGLIQIAR